jgi:hypothetical protein
MPLALVWGRKARRAEARANQSAYAHSGFGATALARSREQRLVGLGRLELPTSRLSSARSNQLSYKPLTREARSLARNRLAPMHRTSANPTAQR